MGEFVCDSCGQVHNLFDGNDPIQALDRPAHAEISFTPDMQDSPSPEDISEHEDGLSEAVDKRIDKVALLSIDSSPSRLWELNFECCVIGMSVEFTISPFHEPLERPE